MVERLKKIVFPAFLILSILFFYSPFLSKGLLPVPSDTIVGLYHPYRDLYKGEYPNGIPFKNFLITDPVRQTYVWKELALDLIKIGETPSWNPYEMAGKPLAGNFQSSPFYPLNIVFFILPFNIGWAFFIILQSILAALFMYLFLKGLRVRKEAAVVGSIAFTFSGFGVSWLTWGTVLHTVLWLPLLLFCVDRIFIKRTRLMIGIFILALASSLLAGHPQSFFYVVIILTAYFLIRWIEHGKRIRHLLTFVLLALTAALATFAQWYPSLLFIANSARSMDRNFADIEGWFLPWNNLAQFVSPDFFGNPATLNYFGVFNYAEFVGYVGVVPLLLSLIAFTRIDKNVIFFGGIVLLSLIFCLPTGISSIPYLLSLPFVSSAQPTRLILAVCFGLSVLSALGLNTFLKQPKDFVRYSISVVPIVLVLVVLWIVSFKTSPVSVRNMVFPSVFLVSGLVSLSLFCFVKNKRVRSLVVIFILCVISIDVIRFGQKFTPFTDAAYLFPQTSTTKFLTTKKDIFRIASMDRRILAPNFATHYKIQSIEGYDPLYLKNYAEYITALERGKPDAKPPFGFNRIITPHNYESQLFDFLNVKYVLSLDELNSPKLKKVHEEGSTKIYENINSFDRAYFVDTIVSQTDAIKQLYELDLKTSAVVSGIKSLSGLSVGEVIITSYLANQIKITTYTKGVGFLVLSDAYYPTWSAYIDGQKTEILKTNHAFRGIFVPAGKHTILFVDSLFKL